MGTIFQTVEQPQGLQEADDITINTNFNGDAQNITQNTFAYENNGLSFNNIGSMFGNFFDFNTQGNNFRWSSLVDMFGQVGGYNAPRGDVLGLDVGTVSAALISGADTSAADSGAVCERFDSRPAAAPAVSASRKPHTANAALSRLFRMVTPPFSHYSTQLCGCQAGEGDY